MLQIIFYTACNDWIIQENVWIEKKGDYHESNRLYYFRKDLLMIVEMVKEQSTPEGDILSDHIFKYELQTDEITEVM